MLWVYQSCHGVKNAVNLFQWHHNEFLKEFLKRFFLSPQPQTNIFVCLIFNTLPSFMWWKGLKDDTLGVVSGAERRPERCFVFQRVSLCTKCFTTDRVSLFFFLGLVQDKLQDRYSPINNRFIRPRILMPFTRCCHESLTMWSCSVHPCHLSLSLFVYNMKHMGQWGHCDISFIFSLQQLSFSKEHILSILLELKHCQLSVYCQLKWTTYTLHVTLKHHI